MNIYQKFFFYLCAALILIVTGAGFAFTQFRDAPAETPASGVALIELYTSEGCSSCPPADMLAARIQREYRDRQVYILAYHVDYWNRLGWKDAFSSPDYSARQRKYAGYLHTTDGVYTPQAIVNGKTQFVGSDQPAMYRAVNEALRPGGRTTLTLDHLISDKAQARLQYHISGTIAKNTLLMLALVQKHAETKVKAGENAGRTLAHINIVRKLQTIPLGDIPDGAVMLKLPQTVTGDDWEIIGFIQNNRTGAGTAAARAVANGNKLAKLKSPEVK